MNQANDWASSDPTQNITLDEADQFRNQLASALAIQFADRYVKTATGQTIQEPELRRNPLPAAPVNLWGTLAGVGASPVNVAQMRNAIRSAARGQNPAGDLENILRQALPKTDISTIILRLASVASAIGAALAEIR